MIEAFCVKSEDLTDQELNIMLEKCVYLGAYLRDWVEGFDKGDSHLYDKNRYDHWGVDSDFDTFTSNNKGHYNGNLLTKEEAFEMLGLTIKLSLKLEDPKEKKIPETLQEANCSLTIDNKEFILFDKDTDLTYYLSDEDFC